jgi:hypothetical protein
LSCTRISMISGFSGLRAGAAIVGVELDRGAGTTAEVTAGDLCCGISGAFDGGEELRPVWLGLQAETRAAKLPALPETAAERAALSSRRGA